MSGHRLPVGGARYEDGDVRAASEGIVDPCGVGTSEYRLRYVVESLGNAHAYPPDSVWTVPSPVLVRVACGTVIYVR